MTSMLDQYAQASQKHRTPENFNPEMTTSGYLQIKLHEDVPIFTKKKLNFNPTSRITHLVVANDYLVLAMANQTLFRIDLKEPEKHDEITISKYTSAELTNLFMDPLGQHLLLSFAGKNGASPELFYLSRKTPKIRPTNKFRNHEITAVAWNHMNDSEINTGPILLGTSKGLIFESEIGFAADKIFQSNVEQYWRQVFDIGKGKDICITGLEFYRVPNSDRHFIIVTTPDRLYQFIGNADLDEKPLLQQIFSSYLNKPEVYQKIDSSLDFPKLCFSHHRPKGIPNMFAWMTEPGIYYGELDPFGLKNINSVINIGDIIEYPKSSGSNIPLNFVITSFHALLLYNDSIKCISLLNEELVCEDLYPDSLINIVKDPVSGTIWSFTNHNVYRYKITKEERDVWRIFCTKKQFELAKTYSKDNPANYDQVLIKEAEDLFDKGEYETSAERYSETESSFEVICLKFLMQNELKALQVYLDKKLDKLKVQDSTQITLIVLWMIELYLNQLGTIRSQAEDKEAVCRQEDYVKLQETFIQFLKKKIVLDCIKRNEQVVNYLMASHGDQENLIILAIINKKFDKVIQQNISKNKFSEALEDLKNQNNRELYYQFVPTLIRQIPKKTVNVLIQQMRNLSPIKLLPCLVGCENDPEQMAETMRYLEHCVFTLGTSEKAVHNFLLSLYVKQIALEGKSKNSEKQLMQYLATQGQEENMVFYDVHYALRLCQENGLTEACVQLLAMLGLWESAIDLALTLNEDLAKQIANMPDNDNELTKKLWLKIAKHVVGGKNDIENAMEFLQQCDLIKIEDILPFFSDFDTIDHFKEAICSSLQEYNQHIEDIKEEMEEATKASTLVREEIQAFRNRCQIIKTDDVCAVCSLTLMIRPFYYFPCTHKFHYDCLLAELTPFLGSSKRNKLSELNRQLTIINTNGDNVSTNSASLSKRDAIRADIDNIVASECVYCGEYMLREIDTPFIDDEHFDQITKDWA